MGRKKRTSLWSYLKGWKEIAQGNTEHQAWPWYSFSTLAQCVIPRRSHLALSLSFPLNILSIPPPIPLTPICPLPTPAVHVCPRSSIEDPLNAPSCPFPTSVMPRPISSPWALNSQTPHTAIILEKLEGGRLLNSSPPLGKKPLSCLHLKERVKYLQNVQRHTNMCRDRRKGVIVLKFSLSFSANLTFDHYCDASSCHSSYSLMSRLIWYGELHLNIESTCLHNPIVNKNYTRDTFLRTKGCPSRGQVQRRSWSADVLQSLAPTLKKFPLPTPGIQCSQIISFEW